MKISVVGTGYVGLTAGVCLAESGNEVIGVDVDEAKVESLSRGELPIYEPELRELLESNVSVGRLRFTCDINEAIHESLVIFVAVGTPPDENGLPDTREVESVCRKIVTSMPAYRLIVIKSTVPIGTTRRLRSELSKLTDAHFDIVNNPEFLKEGCAVEDFLRPDRVIIGSDNPESTSVMEEMYKPFVRSGKPIVVMDPTSSEMTKYASNAMLSTKISFINEISNLCERVGADINSVRRGICSDSRIGYQFLYPGLGFGGSCFPKDMQALVKLAEQVNYPGWLINAVLQVNEFQRESLQRKAEGVFGKDLSGRKFAIWGLSFKPRTDDIRESPAIGLIGYLLAAGSQVIVHDPKAMENVKKIFGDKISYSKDIYKAIDGVDGLFVVTEWNEFRNPDYRLMMERMKKPVIFDGRNVYDADKMAERGFGYFGIGRGTTNKR